MAALATLSVAFISFVVSSECISLTDLLILARGSTNDRPEIKPSSSATYAIYLAGSPGPLDRTVIDTLLYYFDAINASAASISQVYAKQPDHYLATRVECDALASQSSNVQQLDSDSAGAMEWNAIT